MVARPTSISDFISTSPTGSTRSPATGGSCSSSSCIALLDSVIPIVPSETAVIIGGVAAGAGNAEPRAGHPAPGRVGAFLGDNIAYLIGRRFSAADQPAGRPARPKTREAARVGGPTRSASRGGPAARSRPASSRAAGRCSRSRAGSPVSRIAGSPPWIADRRPDLGDLRRRARLRLRRSTFEDNHTLAFLLAFGAALSITHRDRGRPPPSARSASRKDAELTGSRRVPSACVARGAVERRQYRDRMLAVVPVRDGVLPAGSSRRSPSAAAGRSLAGSAPRRRRRWPASRPTSRTVELGTFRRGAGPTRSPAASTADASSCSRPRPDGRDLAPRLAHVLGRRLLAGAIAVAPDRRHARPRRRAGRSHDVVIDATGRRDARSPAHRGVLAGDDIRSLATRRARSDTRMTATPRCDPTLVDECLPPDVGDDGPGRGRPRSSAAGPGSTARSGFAQLAAVGAALGAAMGATRVDHRPGLGRPRAPDRHDGRRRRPGAVRRVRRSAARCSTPPGSASPTTSSA